MKKITIICSLILTFLIAEQSFGCTTFLISGKHTADGRPLLYKHRDTNQMQNTVAIFDDGRYKYMGIVNGTPTGYRMVWGGYNETGFGIMNSAAYNNNVGDTTSFKGQEGVLMKLALQICATLEDFERLLDTLPKPLGVNANFGVIDASGGAAFYETGNFKYIKFDANSPDVTSNGILVRTNHAISSPDPKLGFGYNRFKIASDFLNKAMGEGTLSSGFLLNGITRNMNHPLTNTNLLDNIPESRDVAEFRFFLDYIPRIKSTSTMLIVGAMNKKDVDNMLMWSILGFPLTSVAIPTWLSVGDELPMAVRQGENFQAPLCNASLKFKEDCFPIDYDNGLNYINLSAVVNKENKGYMQLLLPLEEEIIRRTDLLVSESKSDRKMKREILDFYSWVDEYLSESLKESFGYDLFNPN